MATNDQNFGPSEWPDESDPAAIEKVGVFIAHIVGITRPGRQVGRGVSVAAWEIKRVGEDKPILRSFRCSDRAESTHYRATVAAAARVLLSLSHGSTVSIRCLYDPVISGVNGDVDGWCSDGRVNNGNRRPALDIWGRYLKIRKERELDVSAYHPKKSDVAENAVFQRLKKLARKRGDYRLRELVVSGSSFGGEEDD